MYYTTNHLVKSEIIQINNEYFLVQVCPKYCMEQIYVSFKCISCLSETSNLTERPIFLFAKRGNFTNCTLGTT